MGKRTTIGLPTRDQLVALAHAAPHLRIEGLRIGYGAMEVVHAIDLMVGRGQSVCLIGPNGAGKSTVLHGLFGLADVFGGSATVGQREITGAPARALLLEARMAYMLQTNSIFPDMTVRDNLLIGGHLLSRQRATAAAERILENHPLLAERRHELAGTLSGGERRMLELSRALITEPEILLVDEPSIGLEPAATDIVFEMLKRLQDRDGTTIVIVEQNVRRGLMFADIGYVMVAGRVVLADRSQNLLDNPQIGRLFLGG
jgi:branched-chain amino acid transport system ATP-binding protein